MKIAIAGYGIEGRASYQYFRQKYPHAVITILDEQVIGDVPSDAEIRCGDGVFAGSAEYDMVIRTPALSPRHITTNGRIWSATNEFFAECPAPIIGVTGTKGKGTTCSLIASILRAAGKTVHLVGNIGTPALEILPNIQPDDIVIYELSSFQLWDLETSPHIAVVLMIEPDHLDVHEDFEEYVAAKAHIAAHQTEEDIVIYHPTNKYARKIARASAGKKQRYGVSEDGGVFVRENTFFVQENAIRSVDTLYIAGVHNHENACAALSAVKAIAPEVTHEQVAEGLAAFHGLPHRLKFVGELNGVKYYDDSIATTPGSAIAAIRAFSEPKVIILGGSDKGADYTELVELCRETETTVIAIGQTGKRIMQLCSLLGVPCERATSMVDAVSIAQCSLEQEGGVAILSPASASFDMFKNYADRGEQFIEAVKALQ